MANEPLKPISYETAVYVDDMVRLAGAVADLLRADDVLADLDKRMLSALSAGALLMAAQQIDGAEFDAEGVTGRMCAVMALWARGNKR